MTNSSDSTESAHDGAVPHSDTMSNADTANGENPDTDEPDADTKHRTGRRQAQQNAENDPPA